MLTRTRDAALVNGLIRDAFGDPTMDVSEVVRGRANYVLVSDDAVALFVRGRSRGTYTLTLGVVKGSQGKGVGGRVAREAMAWMFANTKAKLIRALIDDGVAVNRIADKLGTRERPAFGGRTLVTCTRKEFEGGADA